MAKMTAGRPSARKPAKHITDIKQEGTTRLNVDIPSNFYKQLKMHALMNDQSLTELVKSALHKYMEK